MATTFTSTSPSPPEPAALGTSSTRETTLDSLPVIDRPTSMSNTVQSKSARFAAMGASAANWPSCCPIVRHDITHDIPVMMQKMVRRSFILWKFLILVLFFNLLGVLVLTLTEHAYFLSIVLAILYFLIIPILSFFLWHYPLYKALRDNSLGNFLTYFVTFGIFIVFSFFIFLGVFEAGGGGIVAMSQSFHRGNLAAGTLCAICTGLALLLFVLAIIQLIAVRKLYKNRGFEDSKYYGNATATSDPTTV